MYSEIKEHKPAQWNGKMMEHFAESQWKLMKLIL